MITTVQPIYSREVEGLGTITLQRVQSKKDIEIIYSWVTKPYAKYWGMLTQSIGEVHQGYKEIEDNPHHNAYIGMLNNEPIFLMERYKASEDVIASHYEAKPNDYGMHILVAPAQKRIPKLTWHVFSTVINYFFSLPFVDRIVVEPDVNNEKIHVLNKKGGFKYDKEIQLPNKKAMLAFCTKESYQEALSNF